MVLLMQFSVLRYESVIHEFDPYFNYRSTIKLVSGMSSTAAQPKQTGALATQHNLCRQSVPSRSLSKNGSRNSPRTHQQATALQL